MLWLAGLMGLLAACAFSFLGYLVLRRPWAKPEPEGAPDATDSESLENPDEAGDMAPAALLAEDQISLAEIVDEDLPELMMLTDAAADDAEADDEAFDETAFDQIP